MGPNRAIDRRGCELRAPQHRFHRMVEGTQEETTRRRTMLSTRELSGAIASGQNGGASQVYPRICASREFRMA